MSTHRAENSLRSFLRRLFAPRKADREIAAHRQYENDKARVENRPLPYPDEQDWRRS